MIRMRKLGEGQWVFRSRVGTTINSGNALKRYIHPASRELGFRLGGWHDFRHTMATQSMMSGAPTKVVSEILGHSDVQTTMKIYQHAKYRESLGDAKRNVRHVVTRCYEMRREAGGQSRLSNSSVRGWSREWELNPRPADYESAALPLSYLGPLYSQ